MKNTYTLLVVFLSRCCLHPDAILVAFPSLLLVAYTGMLAARLPHWNPARRLFQHMAVWAPCSVSASACSVSTLPCSVHCHASSSTSGRSTAIPPRQSLDTARPRSSQRAAKEQRPMFGSANTQLLRSAATKCTSSSSDSEKSAPATKMLFKPKSAFCRMCGGGMTHKHPDGDKSLRYVCTACGYVDYFNPKIVCGCIVEHEGQVRPSPPCIDCHSAIVQLSLSHGLSEQLLHDCCNVLYGLACPCPWPTYMAVKTKSRNVNMPVAWIFCCGFMSVW